MWEWQHAWILQSVVYAGRRGDLRSVIANADAINVDIPSRDEMERTIGRLEAAGLIEANGLHVRARRSGKRLVRRSGRGVRGIRLILPVSTSASGKRFPSQRRRQGGR